MIEALLQQERELDRAKILGETAKIRWSELQRFFAAGKVLQVSNDLDLIDVAYAVRSDEVDRVKSWTEEQQLLPVSDDQARNWIASDALLWSVVIKPWVLVQTRDSES